MLRALTLVQFSPKIVDVLLSLARLWVVAIWENIHMKRKWWPFSMLCTLGTHIYWGVIFRSKLITIVSSISLSRGCHPHNKISGWPKWWAIIMRSSIRKEMTMSWHMRFLDNMKMKVPSLLYHYQSLIGLMNFGVNGLPIPLSHK